MKPGIHPDYHAVTVHCACGHTFPTAPQSRATCCASKFASNCHPFFTGKQKLLDTAGRVERFTKKYADAAAKTAAAKKVNSSFVRIQRREKRFNRRFLPPVSLFDDRVEYPSIVATQSRMFDGARPAESVESAPPRVTLRKLFNHPFDSAIAAARTCYADHLIAPEEVTDKQRLNIGAATFNSGHHTVFQHATFEFGLENVSRQFVWSFLHAHPFYNSEQQSQRYVRMDRVQAYVPPVDLYFNESAREIYETSRQRAWNYYRELSALLVSDTRAILGIFGASAQIPIPSMSKKSNAPPKNAPSKIARYVLPRRRLPPRWSTPSPASSFIAFGAWPPRPTRRAKRRAVVGAMVSLVKDIDPQFFDRFGTAPLENYPNSPLRQNSSPMAKHLPTNSIPSSPEKPPNLSTTLPTLLAS